MDRSDLPDHITPQVGQALVAKGPEGQELNITIKALDEQSVTLDANHPLAGKDLTFEITLVENRFTIGVCLKGEHRGKGNRQMV